MAVCHWCNQEMTGEVSDCTGNVVVFQSGVSIDAIPWDGVEPCHDCNVRPGGRHHPGCDMERCPKCKGQLLSCECLTAVVSNR